MRKSYYNNVSIYDVNSLPRYAAGLPLDSEGNTTAMCIDGQWQFFLAKTPHNIPKNYQLPQADLSAFGTIKVPSEWQIEGHDTPIYTNIRYPKAICRTRTHIKPSQNTVGCYRTVFSIDSAQKDKRVFIKLDGVNSAAEVYINGNFVGYSEDTFSPQEYEITKFVTEGDNVLAVNVYRYCTGSYLEDQDMWRLSGIFRSVYVVYKPQIEVADGFSYSKLSKDFDTAEFVTKLNVSNHTNSVATMDAEVQLSLQGKVVATINQQVIVGSSSTAEAVLSCNVDNIELWSDETPNLYDVTVKLYNHGQYVDGRTWKFGFRKIEVLPKQEDSEPCILLNGKKIKLFGVNRHEFHPEYGHAVPALLNEQDILLCKRNNISAIRTSHYPDSDAFYQLCDKLGVLVVSETNLETHGMARRIPDSKQIWSEQCVYRAVNMVNRLKNHPCIVMWSLGNEAGYGSTFAKMKEAIKAIDKTRLIHYHPDQSGQVGDVLSGMYIKLEDLQTIVDNKPFRHCASLWALKGTPYTSEMYKDLPFIQCEYAHAMGNSLGNFADYWQMYRNNDRLSGGFIWDFADQAIKREVDGKTRWCYGGDFGDKPNDGRFCFNGIVRGDRSFNPAMYEVRYQYQHIWVQREDDRLAVYNEYNFTDLSQFDMLLSYEAEGEILFEKTMELKGAPRTTTYYKLPKRKLPEDKEVVLNIRFVTKQPLVYCDAGHTVAYEQIVLVPYKFDTTELNGGVSYKQRGNNVDIWSDSTLYRVRNGCLSSVIIDGKESLSGALAPNFFRATIDNDSMPFVPEWLADLVLGTKRYLRGQKTLRAVKTTVQTEDNGVVTVTVRWKMKYLKNLVTKYAFSSDNVVRISMQVTACKPMERYGFSMRLREQVDGITVYGKSLWENYCDRCSAAKLAVWKGNAEDMIHDYLYPQENGNRTDVRYASIGDQNCGIEINAVDKSFELSVHPYTTEMLDKATHLDLLGRQNALTVNIDGRQRGVGGDVPAIACLKPQYTIPANVEHEFCVDIKFVATNK